LLLLYWTRCLRGAIWYHGGLSFRGGKRRDCWLLGEPNEVMCGLFRRQGLRGATDALAPYTSCFALAGPASVVSSHQSGVCCVAFALTAARMTLLGPYSGLARLTRVAIFDWHSGLHTPAKMDRIVCDCPCGCSRMAGECYCAHRGEGCYHSSGGCKCFHTNAVAPKLPSSPFVGRPARRCDCPCGCSRMAGECYCAHRSEGCYHSSGGCRCFHTNDAAGLVRSALHHVGLARGIGSVGAK